MQNIINVERGQYYKDKLYSSYNHHQQDYKDLNQGRLFRYIERGKMLIVSHREARPGQAMVKLTPADCARLVLGPRSAV